MTKIRHTEELWGCFHGSASLGERGQVVIPKELRDALQLKKGTKFLVMEKHGALVFMPTEVMENFVSGITKHLKKIK